MFEGKYYNSYKYIHIRLKKIKRKNILHLIKRKREIGFRELWVKVLIFHNTTYLTLFCCLTYLHFSTAKREPFLLFWILRLSIPGNISISSFTWHNNSIKQLSCHLILCLSTTFFFYRFITFSRYLFYFIFLLSWHSLSSIVIAHGYIICSWFI